MSSAEATLLHIELERERRARGLEQLDLVRCEAEGERLRDENDRLRGLLALLMDPRTHWAAGIYTEATELLAAEVTA